MTFIFIMSGQTSQESSQLSGGIVSKLIAAFYRDFDLLTAEKQLEIANIVSLIVRKLAHFFEYFVLGTLAFLSAFFYHRFSYKIKVLCSFLFCVIYAASDEIHQFFIPGRACRFTDVCIDSFGSATAIFLIATIIFFKKRHKLGEQNAKKETN